MKDVTGLLVVVFLIGRVGGMEPSSGYCIGNQCFTVFQDSSEFTAAQRQCTELNGHLMTVRSSVAHDVLLILLGNFSGRYWIGLQLPTGCPDDSAELRGFQWVTKDSASDLYDWAPGFDGSCSSPRCVSVSKDSKFQWVQDDCGEPAAGFLCEYSFQNPCKSLTVAEGESITYTTPFGFGGEDVLSLPPGSTAIRMPAETKHVCYSEQWVQAPWTCEIEEGGCEYKCTIDPDNAPLCYCPPGQSVNPANQVTCEVASDDPCLKLRCEFACFNDGESHACTCDQGYTLARDGRSCVDFDDCTDERQCPGDNVKCVNIPGGFECVCKDGYRQNGDSQCVDVNECASGPCEHLCDNTPGSYECSCYHGYKVDPESPHKCKLHCGAEMCDAECDPNDRFQCYCPEGYISEERPDRTVCIDFNECESNFCDQDCDNTFGGYVCRCYPGHTLVDDRCVKDEDDGWEGSGATTTLPHPPLYTSTAEPTRQPSAVSVGGLVGIIVCTVIFILVVVFLIHHVLSGRGKMESAGALKAAEGEAHGLHQVATDAC